MAAVPHNESVGIMHPAYFVGRNELLEWLNKTFLLRLTRIEETASGAVACQVIDFLFPGVVQMSRVNWGAKADWEFIANYKVLQSACTRLGVQRTIEVDRLIKAKHQDNLEFLQWLKKFFDDNYNGNDGGYDPIARRALGKNLGQCKWAPTSSSAAAALPETTRRVPVQRQSPTTRRAPASTLRNSPVSGKPGAAPVSPQRRDKENNHVEEHQRVVMALRQENEKLKQKLETLNKEQDSRIKELQANFDIINRERVYYFEKLRSVEALLDSGNGSISVDELKRVLYHDDGETGIAEGNERDGQLDDDDQFEESLEEPLAT